MTSSVYRRDPIIDAQLVGFVINNAGSGYAVLDSVIVEPPSNGTTATAEVATLDGGVVITVDSPAGVNSGYTDGEGITLSSGTGTGVAGTAVIIGGIVQSVSITNGGINYIVSDTLTITGNNSSANNATIDVDTIAGGAIATITLLTPGIGYSNDTSVTVESVAGVNANIIADVEPNFGINQSMFVNDVEINSNDVSPGGGGILRIYFSFGIAAPTTSINVFNNGILKGALNADANKIIEDQGWYRFDIDVEAGDAINLQSTTAIDEVSFVRLHLVQFGA